MNFKIFLILLFLIIYIDAFALEDNEELSLAEQMIESEEKDEISSADSNRGFAINGFFDNLILNNGEINQYIVLNNNFKWVLPIGLDWLYKITPGVYNNFNIFYSKNSRYIDDRYFIYINHQYSFYLLLDVNDEQYLKLNIGKMDPFLLNDLSSYDYNYKYNNLLINNNFDKFKLFPTTNIKNIFDITKYNNKIPYPSIINLVGNIISNNKKFIIDLSYISHLYNESLINNNMNNTYLNYYEYGFAADLDMEVLLKNQDKLIFNIGYEHLPTPKTIMNFNNNKINIVKSNYTVKTNGFSASIAYEITKNDLCYVYKLSYYYTPSFNDMGILSTSSDINISAKKIQYLNLDLSIKNNDIGLSFSGFFSDQKYLYQRDLHMNDAINRFFSLSINAELFLYKNDKYTFIPYIGAMYFNGFEGDKLNKSFQGKHENGLIFNTGIKVTF
ncbi:MAG: hypothetical protein OEY79_03470 [Anaplasmataceae bacterium]|nr:hypothetical protein [Anaplasmataceae bacterium]